MSDNNNGRKSPLDVIGAELKGIPLDDAVAREESRRFSDEGVETDTEKSLKEANEHRNETTRSVFHNLFILGLRVVGLSLILIFFIRVLHIILPEHCHWLSSNNIQEIDRMLFSGAVGGVIIKYLEPILNGSTTPKK